MNRVPPVVLGLSLLVSLMSWSIPVFKSLRFLHSTLSTATLPICMMHQLSNRRLEASRLLSFLGRSQLQVSCVADWHMLLLQRFAMHICICNGRGKPSIMLTASFISDCRSLLAQQSAKCYASLIRYKLLQFASPAPRKCKAVSATDGVEFSMLP